MGMQEREITNKAIQEPISREREPNGWPSRPLAWFKYELEDDPIRWEVTSVDLIDIGPWPEQAVIQMKVDKDEVSASISRQLEIQMTD